MIVTCKMDRGRGMRLVSGKKRVIEPKKSVNKQYANRCGVSFLLNFYYIFFIKIVLFCLNSHKFKTLTTRGDDTAEPSIFSVKQMPIPVHLIIFF
jgi:hypothetical protein